MLFMCFRLFMNFIRESLFIVFTKENLLYFQSNFVLFYTYIFDFVLYFSCLNGCVRWYLCSRLWAWKGFPLNTYISMHARTNRCYNERGSRNNSVRSSIPHCI
jgi:hypothetical protein